MCVIRRNVTLRENKNWKLFFVHVDNLVLKIVLFLRIHGHVLKFILKNTSLKILRMA